MQKGDFINQASKIRFSKSQIILHKFQKGQKCTLIARNIQISSILPKFWYHFCYWGNWGVLPILLLFCPHFQHFPIHFGNERVAQAILRWKWRRDDEEPLDPPPNSLPLHHASNVHYPYGPAVVCHIWAFDNKVVWTPPRHTFVSGYTGLSCLPALVPF